MNMRQVLVAALRQDPDLVPKLKGSLSARIDEKDGPMSTVVQSAVALEPIIRSAVRKRPSKIGLLGLKSAHLLASLAAEDARSNRRLAAIAEKGTVGIVFVDVARFTELTAERGDAEAVALLARLESLVQRAVVKARGEVVKQLGDGFLLAFPLASQAVRGAKTLSDLVERERKRDLTFDVHLRIAVHAGEPLVEQDDLLGHDVNLTARLLDHCKPDEIIVSEAAKELAQRRMRSVTFRKRRAIKIRGLSSKTVVYSATTTSPGNGRANDQEK